MNDYRLDKFSIGDIVVWDDAINVHLKFQEKFVGQLTISNVFDIDYAEDEFKEYGGLNTWESAGHTQMVVIKEIPNSLKFSGAFFKKVEHEKEKESF